MVFEGGRYVSKSGWVFNNLTYLPSPRSAWANNPLGKNGTWTASNGRVWMTECDTARTGRNGCRSYIWTRVVYAAPKAGGGYTLVTKDEWTFNNIVLFTA